MTEGFIPDCRVMDDVFGVTTVHGTIVPLAGGTPGTGGN